MFKITGKKAGIVWDAQNNKPLIKFVDGEAETNDEAVAKKLQDMGYAVDGEAETNDEAEPISKMTVEELKAYADEHGIDLGEATKKKDILATIQEASV